MKDRLWRVLLAVTLIVSLLWLTAGAALAQAPEDSSRFIVSFRELPGAVHERLVESLGGSVIHAYHLVPAIAASIPPARLNSLARSPLVRRIERDGIATAIEASVQEQALSWGVDRIDAELVHPYDTGAGVRVAVIDTGIDLDHPDLNVAGNVSFVSGAYTGNDDNGHGTHVAGIIAALDNGIGVVGVAPDCQIYAVKVLDRNGAGLWSNVIKGIEWSVDNGMQVVNMSLGGTSNVPTALRDACDRAQSRGVVVVAAAGNSGNSSGYGSNVIYPAAYDSVIAVAATDSSNARASFSSTGTAVELAAPGVSIYSTYKDAGYATLSGTSMASPHVAGTAALVVASGVSTSAVRSRLDQTATDLGRVGRDTWYGYGLVNARLASPTPPPPNNPPVARAGGPYSGTEDQPLLFSGAASTDADGDALAYSWSFGDGASGQGVSPSHTYAAGGTYTVTLTVQDGRGGSASDQTTATIAEVNDPPVASAGPDRTVRDADNDGAESITLDGSASADADGTIVSYEWTEGAASLGSGVNLTYTFSVSGSPHTVTLTVTDNQGGSASDSLVIRVLPDQPPVAEAGPNQSALINEVIGFNGSGSSDPDGTIVSYAWDFGDGASASGVTASHAYTSAGTYAIRLTVTDNGGLTGSDTASVSVTSAPTYLLHVGRIDMAVITQYSGWKTYARATVTVLDSRGAAVSGVTVAGHWENATRDSDQGTTNAQGQAVLYSDSLRRPSSGTTFTFVVDSLTRTGWGYDSAANAETRDSVSS